MMPEDNGGWTFLNVNQIGWVVAGCIVVMVVLTVVIGVFGKGK